ncbi:hypothetical protein [Spirosoma sp. KNUC1025]|uniref:hypothetical protein n=1 Tax=Spirosoma sp. KNUC1025 TaxID=2894082 RepID=UPI003867294D|nr:hypothetical protein LN737_02930 [Spirosoma sp. KNUC1025]
MKTMRLTIGGVVLAASLFVTTSTLAQSPVPLVQSASVVGAIIPALVQDDNTAITHLDAAVAALDKGDKAATTQELKSGIAGLEAQAQSKPTSFKDKLLAQASKLKALLPLIPSGALGNGVLGKAVSLAKLASGGNQLEGILAAGSLLGKGSQLTSGLSGIGSALSVLGGQSSGQSLVTSALSTVGKLDQGGLIAKAAEPAAKTQIGSVLNFVKGVL